jgi:threonine dehydrogenase-like Zn-dependent dehydrogenase
MLAVPTCKLHKSHSLSFDQLALTEMLSIGQHAVGRATLTSEDTILVVGAGPIGLAVIEFVRLEGLSITVMDINERRLAWCRDALKIPHCLHATEDPVPQLLECGGGELPSVVFDCTGNRESMMKSFHYVAHGGKLIFVGLFQGDLTFNDPYFHSHEMTLYSSRNATGADLRRTIRLMESGAIDVGRWITHRVAYPEIVECLPRWASGDDTYRKGLVEW